MENQREKAVDRWDQARLADLEVVSANLALWKVGPTFGDVSSRALLILPKLVFAMEDAFLPNMLHFFSLFLINPCKNNASPKLWISAV